MQSTWREAMPNQMTLINLHSDKEGAMG
jgi:hypothetical protein